MPVLVVLHGPCFGGGLQLALAADFRFATPDCELSVWRPSGASSPT